MRIFTARLLQQDFIQLDTEVQMLVSGKVNVAMQATMSSLIDGAAQGGTGVRFRAIDPSTGRALDPEFISAGQQDVDRASDLAAAAAPQVAAISLRERAHFLRTIADELTADGAAIIERAQLETGLPRPRLEGELARTTGATAFVCGCRGRGLLDRCAHRRGVAGPKTPAAAGCPLDAETVGSGSGVWRK